MSSLFEKLALNRCGVHILTGTDELTASAAGCDHFHAVQALGGDLVIASFDANAEIVTLVDDAPVSATNLTLSSGSTLIGKFRAITLTSGTAALTKFNV